MFISELFLNTYSVEAPITGHVDFSIEGSKITVNFTDDEAAEIQAIAGRAWERKQAAIARAILESHPAVPMLPTSEQTVDAEFEEVPF